MLDRYVLHDELAVGGMATVHLGRTVAEARFGKIVAIKRMHPHVARDPQLSAMFLDEARLVSRVRHANVVPVIDVAATPERDLLLVMEFVQGETLATLFRLLGGRGLPPPIAVSIMAGALNGLHAAHVATDEVGRPLMLVHRDVSPQNIIVAEGGIARVLDFGIAKAIGRAQTTRDGRIKGKAAYMAPEQLRGEPLDRRVDVYAAAIVTWEALTARRLFDGDSPEEKVTKILEMKIQRPSVLGTGVPPALDDAILRALSRNREDRFESARDFARALETACQPASQHEVDEWLRSVAAESLERRAALVESIERGASAPPTLMTFEATGPIQSGGTMPLTREPSRKAQRPRRVSRAVPIAIGITLLGGTVALGGAAARRRSGQRVAAESPSAPEPKSSAPIVEAHSPDPAPTLAAPGADLPPVPSRIAPAGGRTRASSTSTPRPPQPRAESSTPPTATATTGFSQDRHE